jgi:hypothetical protein
MVAGSGPLAPATSVEHSSAPYVEHLRLGDIVLACRQGLTGAIRNSVDLSPVDVAHEDIDILLSGTGLWGGQYYYPSFVSVRRWPGRAKAEFKLAAVDQSSKAGQFGKL